jgi:hypothetical protein
MFRDVDQKPFYRKQLFDESLGMVLTQKQCTFALRGKLNAWLLVPYQIDFILSLSAWREFHLRQYKFSLYSGLAYLIVMLSSVLNCIRGIITFLVPNSPQHLVFIVFNTQRFFFLPQYNLVLNLLAKKFT